MTIPDPIRILGNLGRPTIFVALIACCFFLGWVMKRSLVPANEGRKAAHPEQKARGVVDLELAPDETTAAEVIKDWGSRGRMLAAFSIGLDALFIVIYVGILTLGCAMAADGFAERGWTALAALGLFLAWAAVGAGVLDAIENWGLIRMLDGETGSGWPHLTSMCAKIKFLLSGLAAVYVIAAMAVLRTKFFT